MWPFLPLFSLLYKPEWKGTVGLGLPDLTWISRPFCKTHMTILQNSHDHSANPSESLHM